MERAYLLLIRQMYLLFFVTKENLQTWGYPSDLPTKTLYPPEITIKYYFGISPSNEPCVFLGVSLLRILIELEITQHQLLLQLKMRLQLQLKATTVTLA